MNREQRRKLKKNNKQSATATIKLNDGSTKIVDLGTDIQDMNDPRIWEKVQEVLGENINVGSEM